MTDLPGSPEEGGVWARALLEDAGLAAPPPLAVDERDEMLAFLAAAMEGDRGQALYAYLQSGLAIAATMGQVLREEAAT